MPDSDPKLIATSNACRMSYASVNTAVTEYTNGARPAAGTLAHTAVMCWLAIIECTRITSANTASHSTNSAAISQDAEQIRAGALYAD